MWEVIYFNDKKQIRVRKYLVDLYSSVSLMKSLGFKVKKIHQIF